MKKFILLITILLCCFKITYSQPGTLDPSFGNKGIVLTSFGLSSKIVYGASGDKVLIQADGKLCLIFETKGQTLITRFLNNGIIDTSYGENGYSQVVDIPNATGASQGDGKIVVAGSII